MGMVKRLRCLPLDDKLAKYASIGLRNPSLLKQAASLRRCKTAAFRRLELLAGGFEPPVAKSNTTYLALFSPLPACVGEGSGVRGYFHV
jgi:hypothetical protein